MTLTGNLPLLRLNSSSRSDEVGQSVTQRLTTDSRARRDLVRQIHDELAERFHAPILIGGKALSVALGYPTQAAFRQAHVRGALPVHVFPMKQRRGYWAMTLEVAEYIAGERLAANVGPVQDQPQRQTRKRRPTDSNEGKS